MNLSSIAFLNNKNNYNTEFDIDNIRNLIPMAKFIEEAFDKIDCTLVPTKEEFCYLFFVGNKNNKLITPYHTVSVNLLRYKPYKRAINLLSF